MSLFSFLHRFFGQKPAPPGSGPSAEFKVLLEDPGLFTYDENGFTLRYGKLDVQWTWNEINEIEIYKTDLYTIDRIDMDLVGIDRVLSIHEELPGWYVFLERLYTALPEVRRDWFPEVAFPAFAENRTRIFTRAAPDAGAV